MHLLGSYRTQYTHHMHKNISLEPSCLRISLLGGAVLTSHVAEHQHLYYLPTPTSAAGLEGVCCRSPSCVLFMTRVHEKHAHPESPEPQSCERLLLCHLWLDPSGELQAIHTDADEEVGAFLCLYPGG